MPAERMTFRQDALQLQQRQLSRQAEEPGALGRRQSGANERPT